MIDLHLQQRDHPQLAQAGTLDFQRSPAPVLLQSLRSGPDNTAELCMDVQGAIHNDWCSSPACSTLWLLAAARDPQVAAAHPLETTPAS